MDAFSESVIEESSLEWLAALGYVVASGPSIAPGELNAERNDYEQVVLGDRLLLALQRLNPTLPLAVIEQAFRKVTRPESASLIASNRALHGMLVNGVPVEHKRPDGTIAGAQARMLDFDTPENNDWLAVNQFSVTDGQVTRRPDVVVFVNGLPLAVIELKNAADENATIWTAFQQLQTYKQQIPSLFVFNELLVVSDGLAARLGSLTANKEWFLPWRTIEGEDLPPAHLTELEVLIRGVFDKRRFLGFVRHFVVFEDDGATVVKKVAGYHQFHAARHAVETTVQASSVSGDRRCGVVWHTQGSGKSLTMVFYAGCMVIRPEMENPTIVVITDRNDLDDQLFGMFSRCHELLRQKPVQATDRANLRGLLAVASGGIVFTTVQKFFPEKKGDALPLLSDRRNIVVIADEAHRSQYDFVDGFARYMRDALPNASFIGFTGTPIELSDKNTRAVFGDYISVYDIQQAVLDRATVPIFYESRLARIQLDESERPKIDEDFEEITEGEEFEEREKLKTKWAALEALVGAGKRLNLVAKDLVDHFEKRLDAMDGKAMVVCMSRRICVELYDALVRLRPDWHDPADEKGAIKVVMTGSASDKEFMQPHIRSKARREALAKRFKDPKDPMRIVIVRDMWLTGFDAPCLHTMYVDKPMRGHGLMQAIARVNRVFGDKPGGLVVDYIGIADSLKRALSAYVSGGGRGKPSINQDEAVAVLLEKFEVCCDMMHGFDWATWKTATGSARLTLLKGAIDYVLGQEDGKRRYIAAVTALSQAFALAVPHEKAMEIRDDVAFFQAVKAPLVKADPGKWRSEEEIDLAVRQLLSKAVSSEGVLDLFRLAGLKKPDISVLSDEFLAEVRCLPQKNLAVELLRRLIDGEIRSRGKKNVVQAKSFSEMLEKSIRTYQNRMIATVELIEELVKLAKEVREAGRRGEALGLTEDEVAFYDALETNDSAVKVLGDEALRKIAQELVKTVRANVSIDWSRKESSRANLRVMVKRVLRRHGYPPDKREKATQTVLTQAEALCGDGAN